MYPKQLAQYLKNRCLRELPNAVMVADAREKRKSGEAARHEESVRFVIDGPYPHLGLRGSDPAKSSQELTFAKQNLHSRSYTTVGMYLTEWQVDVIVTPELDVIFKETKGTMSPVDRREIEAVLGCAFRGPDRGSTR